MAEFENGQLLLQFDRPLIHLLSPRDIFDRADEDMIRKMFEDKRFEVKPNGIHADFLGEYIVMWANTVPDGGIVVVGVRNDKAVEGCACLSPSRLNEIETAGINFAPGVECLSRRVLVHRDNDGGEDFVILFYAKYHPTRLIKTVSGDVYVRHGDQKRLLKNHDEIRLLQEEKGEVEFEDEPCKLTYPDDFDTGQIEDFVSAVHTKKEWAEVHPADDTLELMHLGLRKDGKLIPNVACALLFAKDPQRVVKGGRIRFLRFDGELEGAGDRWNAVKDEWIDGTIPQLIERASAVIRSQLRTFSRLGADGKFYTSREYPDVVWLEAVVNALVHRSYGNGLRNAPTFVKMFDDRLVIESPGPFPAFVTEQNLHEMHIPRNPYLMEALYFLKHVKMAHEGTRRMKAEMLKTELPEPEWKQRDGQSDRPSDRHFTVRVTLRNNHKQRAKWVDSDVAEILGAQVAATLDDEERRIVNWVAENGRINVTQAQRLREGKRWQNTKKVLLKLVDRGILEQVHSPDVIRDAASHYVLRKVIPGKPKQE